MSSGTGAIAICATFTAEPVADSLQYWLDYLQIPARIEFALYNQVIQTLIDPAGLFAHNKGGLNVVLLRAEDRDRLGDTLNAALLTAASLSASPVRVFDCAYDADPAGDRLGKIPYTEEGFAALGTAIARAFHASRRAPYKVIAVDCDNTLWKGICGERGPRGVELDAASLRVQHFIKARRQEGMLLCVCSKNASEDVEDTFDANPEMPLKRSDFVAFRVNWLPKSENIQSLAVELSLGLDSFIFLDDNPMETAEVHARCPDVLALTLTGGLDLEHVWAFDQASVTAEDRNRTAMVRENMQRRSALAGSLSYEDFLRDLNLEIEIREPGRPEEFERAAQLTQRTNQFNCTTQRFTEADVRRFQILTVFVRDRYGDYGQVGLILYEIHDDTLHVRNFLLSCRVLGKGVEHAMVARLGEVALAQSLSWIEIDFVPTPKNTPARNFLASLGTPRLSPREASEVCFAPAPVVSETPGSRQIPVSGPAVDYAWIATHHRDAASVLEAVRAKVVRRSGHSVELPSDDLEQQLVRLWERVLRSSPIGIHDNFFELGGDSIRAVRLLVDAKKIADHDLPLSALIESPTIAKIAAVLRNNAAPPRRNCLVPIRSSGTRPPFYCVHGIGGDVLELMDLARHLHPDQPFYGIQAVGLITVEEMAAHYIGAIRQQQLQGPYYLGGSSFGGLVAYEMARQLTNAGQPVGMVAMFDTSTPGAVLRPPRRIETFLYAFSLHWNNLKLLTVRERAAWLRRKASRSGRLPEAIRLIQEAGKHAASVYIPREYAGDITLFRATYQPSWVVSDRTLGWKALVRGEIHVYDTPGHHADLVRDPRARGLAQQLEDGLKKSWSQIAGKYFRPDNS